MGKSILDFTSINGRSGTEFTQVKGRSGTVFWCKPYILTLSSKPTGVDTITCYRYSSLQPGAATGPSAVLTNGSTIYHGDVIYISATASAGYKAPSISSSTGTISSNKLPVDGNESITVTAGELDVAPVYITAGTGVSSVFLSASSVGTGPEPAGSNFNIGSTVYGFAVLQTGYNPGSGWTLVSGSTYRVGSITVAVSGNDFGTKSGVLKSFILTISVSGSSYGTYEVRRTSSPYAGAPTGVLSDGATIYYGDVLTGSSSAASSRYTSWSHDSSNFKVCTGSWNGGDTTSPSITVTSQCTGNPEAYLYYWANNTWNLLDSSWGINGRQYTLSGLAFNTTYTFHVAGNRYRTRYDRSASSTNYTGTNGVTGNVTASFSFSEDGGHSESEWIGGNPSRVDISTGSVNYHEVTFATNTNGSWSNSQSMNMPYNASISQSGNTVYIGDNARSFYVNPPTSYTTSKYYTFYNFVRTSSTTLPSIVGTGLSITAQTSYVNKPYGIQFQVSRTTSKKGIPIYRVNAVSISGYTFPPMNHGYFYAKSDSEDTYWYVSNTVEALCRRNTSGDYIRIYIYDSDTGSYTQIASGHVYSNSSTINKYSRYSTDESFRTY